MTRLLVISPHLDDAVFSVGQTLAAHQGSTVATIFTTGTDYDRRKGEDDLACWDLGARPAHLGGPDTGEGVLPTDLEAAVVALVLEVQPERVLVPLGIYHPDHVAVADALRPIATHVYEELPYRVWWPGFTEHRLRPLRNRGARLAGLDTSCREIKRIAVERYASQLDDDLRAVMYVPERIWALS